MVYEDTYRIMITNFLVLALHGIDVNDVWFQQDTATSHITFHVTIDLLPQTFGGRLISRNCDINGPPKSCKLTTLGAVKEKCYGHKQQTIKYFKANFRDAKGERRSNTLEKRYVNCFDQMR